MKLLDTTFLIHYWAGKQAVADYLETHEESEFVTTTLNVKEIAVGRELQGEFDRAEILEQFRWVSIVPITVEHGFVAGQLEAELRRNPDVNQDKINAVAGDLLVAAVASAENATVVTRNTDDFELFDVAVDTY